MANVNRLQEIRQGYILVGDTNRLTSLPMYSFVTPGISARTLYSRYSFTHNSSNPNNPYITEEKLQGPEKQLSASTVIDKTPTVQQVGLGHGHDEGDTTNPTLFTKDKMNKILNKMQQSAFINHDHIETVTNPTEIQAGKGLKRKTSTVKKPSESVSSGRKFIKWY